MKICYLADAQSVHTHRWVQSVADQGHEIILLTYRPGKINGIKVLSLNSPNIKNISPIAPFWSRFHYLFSTRQAREIIDRFSPDILHSFWATSYGLIGARMHHPNFIVSVWGQDITQSPRKSLIMKFIIKYVLKNAKYIC